MKTLVKKSEMIQKSLESQRNGKKIGFIPTMGALHAGHIFLVTEAQKICDEIIVSIFVNPTQFGPTEDFAKYPRPISEDVLLLEKANVDILFAPSVLEIYGANFQTTVTSSAMSKILCGQNRPGHFDGVCTIVSKLFNIVKPDLAFFGKKDYQQFSILTQLVKDLDFSIKIIGVETLREASGLALSSRNRYLSSEERIQAAQIFRALNRVSKKFKDGSRDVKVLVDEFCSVLADPIFKIEYCEIRHPENLAPFDGEVSGPAQILVAVKIGSTRLIDNIMLT